MRVCAPSFGCVWALQHLCDDFNLSSYRAHGRDDYSLSPIEPEHPPISLGLGSPRLARFAKAQTLTFALIVFIFMGVMCDHLQGEGCRTIHG